MGVCMCLTNGRFTQTDQLSGKKESEEVSKILDISPMRKRCVSRLHR